MSPLAPRICFAHALVRWLCGAAALAFLGTAALAQTNVYWDTNGNSSGASSGTTAAGTWAQNSGNMWSTSTNGGSTGTWQNKSGSNGIAWFAAGSNATGAYTVTVSRTISGVRGIQFQEGTVTLGGTGTLTLSSTPTINTNANNATISANLAGSTGFTKTGTGTLTLSGNNSYTGGTTLSAGNLTLGSDTALGTGALTIGTTGTISAAGGSRSLSNSVVANSNFTFGGSQNLTLSGAFSLGGGDRTITVDNTATTTLSGVVSQSYYANVIKAGAGRLELTNANTFTGPVTVSDGTLAISNNNALGQSGTWNNVVANGATLEFSNNIGVTLGGVTITGTGDGGVGAINNLSGNNTLTGQVVLGGATTINATGGSLTFNSYTDLAGYNLIATGSGALAFGAQIGGTGSSLTKSGSGTLTLSGANSYTGGTTLAGGTLVANNASALGTTGNISFTGGTLQYGTGITTDLSSRIAGSSSAVAINTNGNNVTFASSLANTNTGGLAKSGSGTLTLANANSYSGATTVTGGALNLQNDAALGTSSGVTVSSGASLQLQGGRTITGVPLTLAGGTLESVSGTNQWAGNVTLTASSSILSSTAGQTFTVGNNGFTNTITMGANTLTVGGAGDTQINSFIGQSGDTGGFTKDGSGTVRMYGDRNYYTGTTWVKDGTLILDTLNTYQNLTILGNLTIGDGTGAANSAVVQYTTGNGHNKIADTSTVTINEDGLLDLNGRRDTIGALVMTGGHIDTRNQTSPTVNQGTLTLAGDVTTNASAQSSVIDGYQFSLNDISTQTNVRNFTIADGAAASDLTINAQVVYGGINKLGAGTMTLTGSNTYGGTTTVGAGVLAITNNTALGATGGGADAQSTTVNNNATLRLSNDITVAPEALTLNGNGVGGTMGALQSQSGNNTWTGAISIATDSLIKTDAGTLTLTGNIVDKVGATSTNITVGGAGDTYISGSVGTEATGLLTKVDSGTLFLSGNNTYKGTTTVQGGVVNISSNDALGSVVAGTTVQSGAALQLQNNINVSGETLSLNGTGVSSDGALRNMSGANQWGGAVTVASTARINTDAGSLAINGSVATGSNTLYVGGAANTTIAGQLTGTSSSQLTKDGAGTLTLSNSTNTFAGNVTVSAGTLAMGASNALNSSTIDLSIASGATLSLVGFAEKIGTLAGIGSLDFGTAGTLTLDGGLSLLEVSQLLGTGTIVVNAGSTLRLGANFNASGINIQLNGGTLELNGTTTTFGTLSVTGNSIIDFASTDSVINLTTLSLTSYTLSVASWNDSNDLFLVANDPGNKATTPLNNVTFAPSGSWVGNDTIWTTDYPSEGFDHNNEVRPWKPVPEPSTYGAMLMGAGLAFFGYRRWRQQRAVAAKK